MGCKCCNRTCIGVSCTTLGLILGTAALFLFLWPPYPIETVKDIEGRECSTDSNCTGTGYTGHCDTDEEECECSDGYKKIDYTCKDARLWFNNDPGRECSMDSTCNGTGYTGYCDSDEEECECSDGYVKIDYTCKDVRRGFGNDAWSWFNTAQSLQASVMVASATFILAKFLSL